MLMCQGGIDFAVMASGYNAADTMCPCHAWMIPLVEDEKSMACLQWSTEKHELKFDNKTLTMNVGVLHVHRESREAYVRIIHGEKSAVLKRGLL